MKKIISFVMCFLLLIHAVCITASAKIGRETQDLFSEEYCSECEDVSETESCYVEEYSLIQETYSEDVSLDDNEIMLPEENTTALPDMAEPAWNAFQHVSVTFFISVNSLATVSYHAVAQESSGIEATIYIEKNVFGFWQRVDIGTSGNKITDRITGTYISGTQTVKISGEGKYRAVVSVKNYYGSGSSSATFEFRKNSSLADVNNDGNVTAVDARLALRFSAKLQKYSSDQKTRSDVNSDGNITAADARIILRISAKLM